MGGGLPGPSGAFWSESSAARLRHQSGACPGRHPRFRLHDVESCPDTSPGPPGSGSCGCHSRAASPPAFGKPAPAQVRLTHGGRCPITHPRATMRRRRSWRTGAAMAGSPQGRRSVAPGEGTRMIAGCAGGSTATAGRRPTGPRPSAANVGLNKGNQMTAVASDLTMPLLLVAQPAAPWPAPHPRPRPGRVIYSATPARRDAADQRCHPETESAVSR